MNDLSKLPKDWVLTSGQFTESAHNALYPAIDPTKPENSLRGKTVIVTGASRGIGARGIAPAFARAGVRTIILVATNVSTLASVEKELKKINPHLETVIVGADISSAEQVDKAWAVIKARCPKIHVLVNNAGVESTEAGKMMHEQDPNIFMRNFVRAAPRSLSSLRKISSYPHINWSVNFANTSSSRKSTSKAPT